MKTTRIRIRNLFGISEQELDGRNVELTGGNGTGKTSVLDALRYALTNASDRRIIVKNGETEGEIIVETDTGLSINRRKRTGQVDYKSIKENGKEVPAPERFLQALFTPLQLDPVAFTLMTEKEKNRAILDLIEFHWDLAWIRNQFGELPEWVNYDQNILEVLNDLQSENGEWFKRRTDLNRSIRNQTAFIEDIAKDIPQGYQAEVWDAYDLGAAYKKLAQMQEFNSRIQRAQLFRGSYDAKLRQLEADMMIAVSAEEKAIAAEKEDLLLKIERLKGEIKVAEDHVASLAGKLFDKKAAAQSEFEAKKAQLEKDMLVADEYIGKEAMDCAELTAEISEAEAMKKHLGEYERMKKMQSQMEETMAMAEMLTKKIELARSLPGTILEKATLPIDGLSVKDGIPLINGLPVSNLSEGEQLALCVDVAIAKPNGLQIVLIDGTERLSAENREKLYAKCREKGVQFIATRTTDDAELEIHYI